MAFGCTQTKEKTKPDRPPPQLRPTRRSAALPRAGAGSTARAPRASQSKLQPTGGVVLELVPLFACLVWSRCPFVFFWSWYRPLCCVVFRVGTLCCVVVKWGTPKGKPGSLKKRHPRLTHSQSWPALPSHGSETGNPPGINFADSPPPPPPTKQRRRKVKEKKMVQAHMITSQVSRAELLIVWRVWRNTPPRATESERLNLAFPSRLVGFHLTH